MFPGTFEGNVALTMGKTICPAVLDALLMLKKSFTVELTITEKLGVLRLVLVAIVNEGERLFGGCVLLVTVTFTLVVLTGEDPFDVTLLLTVDDRETNAVEIEVLVFVVLFSDGSGVTEANELLLLFDTGLVVLMAEGRFVPSPVSLIVALTVFTSVRLKTSIGSPVNGLTVALRSIDALREEVVVFGKMVPLNGR